MSLYTYAAVMASAARASRPIRPRVQAASGRDMTEDARRRFDARLARRAASVEAARDRHALADVYAVDLAAADRLIARLACAS